MEADALQAAFKHVQQFSPLPLAWPNVPKKSYLEHEAYIRVSLLPTTPTTLTTCGNARHAWILQLAVYLRDGCGQQVIARHIDTIRCHIYYNLTLEHNRRVFRVTNHGDVFSPVQSDEGWFFIPIQFRFHYVQHVVH